MRHATKRARSQPGRVALPIAALALLTILLLPEHATSDDEYGAAMAKEHASDSPGASPLAREHRPGRVDAGEVVYATIAGRQHEGYLARPAGSDANQPGIIVIHEWWGLNDNIRSMARQLAAEGYAALAINVYGGQPATAPADARALMERALSQPEPMLDHLRQANAFLRERGAPRTASLGWCFGGGLSLEAGLLLGDDLNAVVVYYGRPVLDLARLRALRAPLLGFFGEDDRGIPVAGVRQLEANLEKLGKDNEFHIYPGAGHAFANPSGSRYQAVAAQDAWARTLAFFAKHLRE